MTSDDPIIEAATHSTSQAKGEETVAGDDAQPPIEYDEGYESDRFFLGAGWFCGVVTVVQ